MRRGVEPAAVVRIAEEVDDGAVQRLLLALGERLMRERCREVVTACRDVVDERNQRRLQVVEYLLDGLQRERRHAPLVQRRIDGVVGRDVGRPLDPEVAEFVERRREGVPVALGLRVLPRRLCVRRASGVTLHEVARHARRAVVSSPEFADDGRRLLVEVGRLTGVE